MGFHQQQTTLRRSTLKSRILAAIAVLCLSCVAFADAQEDAAMKAWMAYATPGDTHKTMSGLVGTWETTIKTYMQPGEPTEQKGSSSFESVMDGRYIVEKAE